MKEDSVADRVRLAALVLGSGLGGLRSAVRRPFHSFLARRVPVPGRLLIAPQDIRTADPTAAADIYAGYFAFDRKAVNTRGTSPFEVAPPSDAWAAALAGFGWLRHLRAADTALARVNARALVDDWMAGGGRRGGAPGRRPEVVARRVLSWLSQAPLILDGADAVFYRRFMRALARQADVLRAALRRDLAGVERLTALIALCELGLCADRMGRLQRQASRSLAEELGRQILADGGHVSRDPQALLELLLDLLPLRQTYAARGAPTPPPLLNAIDRMMPMVRCLRHGDGSLALFNGMGRTRADVVATVLAYDDARGRALRDARYSGYQRVEAGDALLIVDAGPPPPLAYSASAHAGTLAFEFSHGLQRIIVNCGTPGGGAEASGARGTAAHSTLVLAESSSSRFAKGGPLRGLLYDGPRTVTVERAGGSESLDLALSHDGYARSAGYLHRRILSAAPDGSRLLGEDRLERAPGARAGRLAFAIRFHLHPALRAVAAEGSTAALVVCPDGSRWSFEAGGLAVSLEDSVFFAQAEGPRRAEQLVIHATVPDVLAVAWSLTREPPEAGEAR